ncbi:MAG: hypothetical protein CSA62_13715 [Planctomycetota bacterium]|nr:MAG: hypothetical protein CSA62_13715 [Planctomycetota bacterium]
MILGPTAPHPREFLREWCEQEGGGGLDFEFGLRPLVRDLTFDDGVQIHALACDAAHEPVALLGFDSEDQDEALQQVVDLDCWYERSGDLLQKVGDMVLPERLRIFVLLQDCQERVLARLRRLGDVELSVFELRELYVAGQRRTVLSGVPPWDGGIFEGSLGHWPGGFAGAEHEESLERLFDRLRMLPGLLSADGDRFSRHLRLDGEVVLHLFFERAELWAWLPGHESALPLRGSLDVDHIIDGVLRALLAREENAQAKADAPAKPSAAENGARARSQGGERDSLEKRAVQEKRKSQENGRNFPGRPTTPPPCNPFQRDVRDA